MKEKKPEFEIRTCPECAGVGNVPHHHITNKRNKKVCPTCKGEGEIVVPFGALIFVPLAKPADYKPTPQVKVSQSRK